MRSCDEKEEMEMKLTNLGWLCDAGSRAIRKQFFLILMSGALWTAPIMLAEAAVSTTTVQGTVYLANGQPGSGMLHVSWPAFMTANGQAIVADNADVTIGEDGFLTVNLAPNQGAMPGGLYYTATFYMSDGSVSTQYWEVPAAAQATLAQVQAQVMPAAQAVQAVNKSYVDQAIAQLNQSGLLGSGGPMTGPLYLSGDPTQPLQAADKHYVDLAVSQAGSRSVNPGGPGQVAVYAEDGTSLTGMSGLSSDGSNGIAVTGKATAASIGALQINNAYHTSAFPSSCVVNGINYATAGDCAFYTALSVAQTTGINQTLVVDPGITDTCSGWDAPVFSNNATVSLVGASNFPGAWDIYVNSGTPVVSVRQTCNIGTKAVITYEAGAGIAGSNGPVATISGLYIDANNKAGACGDFLRLSRSTISNDICVGVAGTNRHGFQFGDSSAPGLTGWMYETSLDHLTVYTNTQIPLTGGGGTVTVSGGHATGSTVTTHGGVGSFTHPMTDYSVIFTGWGVGVSQPNGPQPCATNPTAHVSDLSAGQLWGITVDTTGVGCDPLHTYFAVIPKPAMDEAFKFDWYSDSIASDLVSVGGVNIAAAVVGPYSSGFNIRRFHGYGNLPVMLRLEGGSIDVDSPECDTPLQACIVNLSGSNSIRGGTRIHVGYQLGAGDFWDARVSGGGPTAYGPMSHCNTLQPPLVGYNLYGDTNGPVDFSAGSPSGRGSLSMLNVPACSIDSFNPGPTIIALPAATSASVGATLHFVTNTVGPDQAACTATSGAGDMGGFPGYNAATGILTFPADLYGNGGILTCTDKVGTTIRRSIPSTGITPQTFDMGTIYTAATPATAVTEQRATVNEYANTLNYMNGAPAFTSVGPTTSAAGTMQLHSASLDNSVNNYGIFLPADGSVQLGFWKTFFDKGGSFNDRGSNNVSGLVPGGFFMDGSNGAGFRLQGMGTSTTTALPMSISTYSSNYSAYFNLLSINAAGFVNVGGGGTVTSGFDQSGNAKAASFQTMNGTVIPSTASGYHGTAGARVQLSDGAGSSGNLAKFAPDGSVTDGPIPPMGGIVGTSDTQTLTNKSIAGSEINSGTVGVAYGGTGQNESTATGIGQFSSGSYSVSTALANGTTATTQSAGDNSTRVATTSYVASPGAITPTMVTASGIVSGGNDTTRTTAATIGTTGFTSTGLVLPTVPANTTKNGRCVVLWQMSSTSYTATFGLGMSNSPTGLWGGTSVTYAATGTSNWLAFSQTATTATAISTAVTAGIANTTYRAEIDFTLQTGSTNPVAVTLYGLVSQSSATLSIQPGSACYWLP